MNVCPDCGEYVYGNGRCDECVVTPPRKPRKVSQGSPDDGLRPDESCSTADE